MANDQLIDTESGESSSETAKWVGPSCGQHGSYTFYKGVRFEYMVPEVVQSIATRERPRRGSQSSRTIYDRTGGDERILAVGDTFFVKVGNTEPTCIGELVLLWHDEANSEDLALLRLYYMPETTPAGRQSEHGEDEVLAVAEKITIRITDLPTWIIEPEEWSYGRTFFLPAIPNTPKKDQVVIDLFSPKIRKMFMSRTDLNLEMVNREKEELFQNSICEKHKEALNRTTNHVVNCEENGQQQPTTAIDATPAVEQSNNNDADSATTTINNAVVCRRCDNFHRLRRKLEVVVLGFGEYCRYRTCMKHLEDLAHSGVCLALKRRKIVFCRDSFEYPLVIQDPLVCEEYAPVFKGRPRKRKKNKHSRFTRTKTHKTTKSANDEESSNTSARRKSSRTRHRPKQISPQLLYSMYSQNAEIKASRGRTNSSSSSSASDTQAANKSAASHRQNRKDLRRSKRRRKNSSSDLKIALQNSLLDVGPNPPPYDSHNNAASGNKSRKRKNSFVSSAASGTDKGLTNGRNRKRCFSSTGSSSFDSSSTNSDQLSPASPSSSIKSSSSNDVDDFPDVGDDLLDFDPDDPDSFNKSLMKFMKLNGTPINKIPSLGFKKLNLHEFYTFVQNEGGYQRVTDGKMWRSVYQNTGANPSSTSAATCTRRHYEKLLLPFEKYLRSRSSQLKRKRMKLKTTKITSTAAATAGGKRVLKKTTAPRRQKASRPESSTNSNSNTSGIVTESKKVETKTTIDSDVGKVQLESETKKEPEKPIEPKQEKHSPVALTTPAPASGADDVALDFSKTPVAAAACHRSMPLQKKEAGVEQPLDLSVPKITADRSAVGRSESTATASTRVAQIPQMMLQNGKSTWHKSTTPLNGNCWMNPKNLTSNGIVKQPAAYKPVEHSIFSMTKPSPLAKLSNANKPQNGSGSGNGGLPVHAVKPIPSTLDDPAKRVQQQQHPASVVAAPVQQPWPPIVGGSGGAVNGRDTVKVHPMQRTIANAIRNSEPTPSVTNQHQRHFQQRQQGPNTSNNSDHINSSPPYAKPVAAATTLHRERHHHQTLQHPVPPSSSSSSSSSKLGHNSEAVRRPKESSVHSASGGESSSRTYYRPTSMLAHHRQHKQQVSQLQQQQNAANNNNVPAGSSASSSKDIPIPTNNHMHHHQQQQQKDAGASLLQSQQQQQQHKLRGQNVPPSNSTMTMQQRVLSAAPKPNPASSSNQMLPPPLRNAQHHIKSELEKISQHPQQQQQQQRQQIIQNQNRQMNKYANVAGHQRLGNGQPPELVNFLASQARNDKSSKDLIPNNGQQMRTNMPPPFSHQNPHRAPHFDPNPMILAQVAAASVKQQQQQQQQSSNESVGSTSRQQHQRVRSHDEAHSSKLIFSPSPSSSGTSRAPSDRQQPLSYASVVAQQQMLQQQQKAMSSSKELNQHRQMGTVDLHDVRQAQEQRSSSSSGGSSGYPHVQPSISRSQQSPYMKPPHGEALKNKRPPSHAEQQNAAVAAQHALHSSIPTPPKRPRVFQNSSESGSNSKSNMEPSHSGVRLPWPTGDMTAAVQANYSQNFNSMLTQQIMASRLNDLHSRQLLESNGTAAAASLNGRNVRYTQASSAASESFAREKNHLPAPASSNSRVERMAASGSSNQQKPSEPARPLSFSVDRLTSPSLDKRSQQLSREKSPHVRANEGQKNKQQQQQPNDHRNSNLRTAQQQQMPGIAFNSAVSSSRLAAAASGLQGFHLPGFPAGLPPVPLPRFGQQMITPEILELMHSTLLNRDLLSGLTPGMFPLAPTAPSGQRLPDSSNLNLPLPVEPAFLQSLPPSSAPYAFQNPSSRSANSRMPNFRFHH